MITAGAVVLAVLKMVEYGPLVVSRLAAFPGGHAPDDLKEKNNPDVYYILDYALLPFLDRPLPAHGFQ